MVDLAPGTKVPLIPPTIPKVTVSILAETQDYNHRIMNIPAMWKVTRGKGIKIAILDTGVPKHVDLAPTGGKSFVPGYYEDKCGHSTHVGGLIAAIPNNGMGCRGIAPDAETYYGAVMDADGTGSIESIVAGIMWAVDEVHADIISMSLGLPGNMFANEQLYTACKYAYDHGVTIFAAAGNEGGRVCQPAQYSEVIAVAAVDKHLARATFSNYGDRIDFACGGVDVFSTYLDNSYAQLSGTSMACPALAAVGALILSDALNGPDPRKLTPAELKDKLKKISFDLGRHGKDPFTGDGIPIFQSPTDGNIGDKGTPPAHKWYWYLNPNNWSI